MNKQQKIRIGIIAAGLVLVVAIVAVVIVTVGGSASAYNSHMELAQQYLDELQYEQAIAEYKAAIEIEPKNEEAYLALADIYVQLGDYEAALAILNQGLGETGDKKLVAVLEKIQDQHVEIRKQEEQAEKEVESTEEMQNDKNTGSTRQEYYDDGSYGIWEYNGNGKVLKYTKYYASGAISSINEYAGNGTCVKSVFYYESGVMRGITERNENGNWMKSNFYYESGVNQQIVEFDENGKTIKYTQYYESGAISSISEYDENEHCVKDTWYYESGSIGRISEFDENGEVMKEIYYYEDGRICSSREFYDAMFKG